MIMTTVFAIQFKNYFFDEDYTEVDNLAREHLAREPNNKILDNKIYMNAEDAILALESILDTLSEKEQQHFESGMLEYSVSPYELV